MIKLRDLLTEIGEANTEAYAYRLDFVTSRATFRTEDGTLYEVAFHKDPQGTMELHFGVMDERGNVDQHTETNAGNMYRVMATITAIALKAVERLTPKSILVSAAKCDARRMRLYQQYISRHLQGYKRDEYRSGTDWGVYKKTPLFDPVGLWRRITQWDWTGIKDEA